MEDAVQADLRRWVEHGDRPAAARAITAIAGEWRPIVAAFLNHPSGDLVDEELQDALSTLCAGWSGAHVPRVYAPVDAENCRAWRRKVLKNHLVDRLRRRARRAHAEVAFGGGHSPAVEAEAWRRRRAGEDLAPLLPAADVAPDDLEAAAVLRADRASVAHALQGLAVRRRTLVGLALRFDVASVIPALAKELGESTEAVRARLDVAAAAPADGPHEHLSDLMIRVVYPTGPIEDAREAARKAFERGLDDLRGRFGRAG